jgi:hypothetical protein
MHLPSRCPSTVLHDPNPRTATHRCRLAAEARSLQIGASGGQPSSDLALAPNSSLLSLRFVSQPLGGIGDGERRGRMGGDEDGPRAQQHRRHQVLGQARREAHPAHQFQHQRHARPAAPVRHHHRRRQPRVPVRSPLAQWQGGLTTFSWIATKTRIIRSLCYIS